MLTVLQKVFKDKVATPEWQEKLHQIVPSYGTKLNDSPEAVAKEWAYTANILQLTPPPAIPQLAAPKPSRLPSLRPSRASRSLTWRCKHPARTSPRSRSRSAGFCRGI
jgi:malate dehydrogenase (quinone)